MGKSNLQLLCNEWMATYRYATIGYNGAGKQTIVCVRFKTYVLNYTLKPDIHVFVYSVSFLTILCRIQNNHSWYFTKTWQMSAKVKTVHSIM